MKATSIAGIMITAMFLLVNAAGVLAQEQFAPIVPPADALAGYPLPPVAFGPAQGYVETESSPDLVTGRALVKLSEAQSLERSGETGRLYKAYKETEQQLGAKDMRTLYARAQFLSRYDADLKQAGVIYDAVLDSLQGAERSPDGRSGDNEVIEEAAAEAERIADSTLFVDAACHVDKESCVPPDIDEQALVGEINALTGMLSAGGASGPIDSDSLLKKTRLLRTRATLARLVIRRMAAVTVGDAALPSAGSGGVKPLLPLGSAGSTTRRSGYAPGDVYR